MIINFSIAELSLDEQLEVCKLITEYKPYYNSPTDISIKFNSEIEFILAEFCILYDSVV